MKIEFSKPELLNEHFALLRRFAKDDLVIQNVAGLLRFSVMNDDGDFFEVNIQPTLPKDEKLFTCEPANFSVYTNYAKEFFKQIGKFKAGDTLVLETTEHRTLRVIVNGIAREIGVEEEPKYTIDSQLIKISKENTAHPTYFYFDKDELAMASVYGKFGARLKAGLNIAAKNEPRRFLEGTMLQLGASGEPVILNTDGRMIMKSVFKVSQTNTEIDKSEVPNDFSVFIDHKCTKALADVLANKVLFKVTQSPVVRSMDFELITTSGPERITVNDETSHWNPYALKCLNYKDDEGYMHSALFSFTSVAPVFAHFRVLARQHDTKFPQMHEIERNSLILNADEQALLVNIAKADLKEVIARLEERDSLDIVARKGEIEISVYNAKNELLKTYNIVCNQYETAWPEGKLIRVSVEHLKKILAAISTKWVVMGPTLKDKVETFFVGEGTSESHTVMSDVHFAAMPFRR